MQRLLRWETVSIEAGSRQSRRMASFRSQENAVSVVTMGVWTLETDCHQDVGSRGKATRSRRACSVSPALTGTLGSSLK